MTPEAGNTAAVDTQSLGAVHARLLQNHGLQFDFAAAARPRPLNEPDWLKALGRWLAGAVKLLAPYVVDIFWLGVAAAVAAVLFLIGREILRTRFERRRRATARPTPVDWRPETWKARALLEDADRLAALGRYDEAVRLLLTRSIDDIDARRPRAVSPALTARDIAGLEALPSGARGAFAQIAADVERSLFGGQALDAETFARRRADYEAFAFPQVWA